MDNKSSWSSCTFELEDIEIIDHKNENEEKSEKWNCDQCSLFFLEKAKLNEHKKKHVVQEIVKCKYCNKTISSSVENRQCFLNRKCETCEYKCSKCPQRFLRRSSLMNHEKKHSSPKKKRATIKNKKVNGICTENVAVSKVLKKKQIQTDDSEEHVKGLKTKKSGDSKNSPKKRLNLHVKTDDLSGGIDNSPIKKPKRLSLKASKSTEETSNSEDSPVKVAKPKSQKSNQLSEEKKSEIEHIQKTSAVNSPAVSQTANMSSTENAVNYKPFSCHICGDTFASDSALIDHIKTHGENAARSFRCKFCGDEFGDIYKMQYHLAICPLAEDELESSLKQVLPANIQTKYSGGTLSPRKRGRPKKIVESPLDQECIENESTPSSSKRGNFRKRKSEVLENEDSVPTFTGSSLPKQSKNSKNKDSNRVAEEDFTDTSFCDITEVTKETEPDERKKLHQCPFPRCDFKFTREKALLCHMRNHSDDFEDSLKCHKCDIPFDDIQTLRLHINTCKGIKEERDDDFDRGDCNDSSPNRTFQRSKRDFVCNQCGRSHQSQEKLNRHLESCGSKFVCRICKDDFLNQPLLDEHFASKHPPYTAYHCYVCEEDFISELFLQIHQMDEHEQNLNTIPVQDSVREKVPMFPQKTIHDIDSVLTKYPKKSSSPTSFTPNRSANGIQSSPVTTKTGRCTNSIYTRPVKHSTSRYVNRICCFFWCPICLEGFDQRDNMRYHFRENHVVENNSTYSCEICEIKMPLAEMMCYHLELHSTNLLSVNRFSKLIAYVKQSRVGELRSSGMKIKREEGSEDETLSQVKQKTDVECLETSKVNKEKSKKRIHSLKKTVTNTSSLLSKIIPEKDQVCLLNSTVIDLELRNEHNLALGSRKRKNPSNHDDENKTQTPIELKSIIERPKRKPELKKISRDEINVEKPSRPLRSRALVNYSLRDNTERKHIRQKVELKNVSDEEICVETKFINEKSNTLVTKGYSKALKPAEVMTKEAEPAVKQRPTNKRVQQRSLSLSTKEPHKTSNCEIHYKTSPQVNNEEGVHQEHFVKPQVSLKSDNEEIILSVDDKILSTKETKPSLGAARRLPNRNKRKKHRHSRSKKFIGNICAIIESVSKNEHLSKENISNPEKSPTNESLTIYLKNSGGEGNIHNSPVERRNVDISSGLNFESEERPTVTQNVEQNSLDSTEGPYSEVTEQANDIELRINVQSEDSVDVSKITNEQLTEQESENLPTDTKVQEQEESRQSTISSIEESDGICCTMCTERFFNQDELLDHLATHI